MCPRQKPVAKKFVLSLMSCLLQALQSLMNRTFLSVLPTPARFFAKFVSFLTFLRIFRFSIQYKQLKSRQPYGNEAAASFRFCKPPERTPNVSIWCVSASMPEGGPGFIGAGPGIRDSLKAPGRAVVSVMAISHRPPPAGGYLV